MPPRSAPGGARSGPRGAKEPPEAPEEHPKSRPRGDKKEQTRLPLSFPLLGRLREASGGRFEEIWERFLGPPGWHFGGMFERIFL